MRRGFTLIELLIVIGILAILATAVVLVINPAELLRQGRDAQRLSDLKTLKSSIDLYLARASSPDLNLATPSLCTTTGTDTNHTWRYSSEATNQFASVLQPFQYPSTPAVPGVPSAGNLRAINGTGWIPIDFTSIGGVPIAKLPVDPNENFWNDLAGTAEPSNPPGQFYAYQCQGSRYELNANMESQKYSSGTTNVENKDGGTLARGWNTPYPWGPTSVTQGYADSIYEIGNDSGLDL